MIIVIVVIVDAADVGGVIFIMNRVKYIFKKL